MDYHAMAFDFSAEENELHWHDFDSVLYVTGGELTVWVDGEDESVSCRCGAKRLSLQRELFTRSRRRATAPSLASLSCQNRSLSRSINLSR